MLVYQNGRFSAHGFSFVLPDGFVLNTEPDVCYTHGFGAWTPEGDCYVEWEIEQECTGTLNELRALFEPGSGMFRIIDINPIIINGLPGHHVAYSYKGGQRYEIRLSSGDGNELSFRVESQDTDVLSAISKPPVQAAIQGISSSEQRSNKHSIE